MVTDESGHIVKSLHNYGTEFFATPGSMAGDPTGNYLYFNTGTNIYRFNLKDFSVTSIFTINTTSQSGIAVDSNGYIYVFPTGTPLGRIVRIHPDFSTEDNPWVTIPGNHNSFGLTMGRDGNLYCIQQVPGTYETIWQITTAGITTELTSLRINYPSVNEYYNNVAVNSAGVVFISLDSEPGGGSPDPLPGSLLRVYDPSGPSITDYNIQSMMGDSYTGFANIEAYAGFNTDIQGLHCHESDRALLAMYAYYGEHDGVNTPGNPGNGPNLFTGDNVNFASSQGSWVPMTVAEVQALAGSSPTNTDCTISWSSGYIDVIPTNWYNDGPGQGSNTTWLATFGVKCPLSAVLGDYDSRGIPVASWKLAVDLSAVSVSALADDEFSFTNGAGTVQPFDPILLPYNVGNINTYTVNQVWPYTSTYIYLIFYMNDQFFGGPPNSSQDYIHITYVNMYNTISGATDTSWALLVDKLGNASRIAGTWAYPDLHYGTVAQTATLYGTNCVDGDLNTSLIVNGMDAPQGMSFDGHSMFFLDTSHYQNPNDAGTFLDLLRAIDFRLKGGWFVGQIGWTG